MNWLGFDYLFVEIGSEDDVGDMSEDDFFMVGLFSDDVDVDDEWIDKSFRYDFFVLVLFCGFWMSWLYWMF